MKLRRHEGVLTKAGRLQQGSSAPSRVDAGEVPVIGTKPTCLQAPHFMIGQLGILVEP